MTTEAFDVTSTVGLGRHRETQQRTAVAFVTVNAPALTTNMTPDQALALALNLSDAAEAALDDTARVQDAIDAGVTDTDELARIAQEAPQAKPDAGCPHTVTQAPCSDCAGGR